MPDPAVVSSQPARSFSWSRALLAGLVATIVMTIVMVATGMNLPKSLGVMFVGSNAGAGTQYAVGGTMHLMIGLIYGVIFAWLVGRVTEWNPFIKGTVYGLAIAAIAFAAMPLMSAMMGGGKGAGNPCNPSGSKPKAAQQQPMNPCHPKEGAMNPCHPKEGAMNPCHPKEGAMNPCHPTSGATAPSQQASGASNPCHTKSGAGNPCNPCGGGGGGSYSGLLSVVNHLIYGLTLAFVYGKSR
jgi:hypothetical protein